MSKLKVLLLSGLFIATPVEAGFLSAIAKIAKGADEIAAVKNVDEIANATKATDNVTEVAKITDETNISADELLLKIETVENEALELKPVIINETDSPDVVGTVIDVVTEVAGICEQDCQLEESD